MNNQVIQQGSNLKLFETITQFFFQIIIKEIVFITTKYFVNIFIIYCIHIVIIIIIVIIPIVYIFGYFLFRNFNF